MKNKYQHLIEVQSNELLNLTKTQRVFQCTTWYLENRYSRLLIKREYKDDIFKTITSTKGTCINVKR